LSGASARGFRLKRPCRHIEKRQTCNFNKCTTRYEAQLDTESKAGTTEYRGCRAASTLVVATRRRNDTMVKTHGMRPLVAGNWKMNGLRAQLEEAIKVREEVGSPLVGVEADVMICPPATLVAELAGFAQGWGLKVGGQDCHWLAAGAYTGDISAEMLRDAGAVAVIVGHSERRAGHGELDRVVKAKAQAAYRAGLVAIVCIGETAGERRAGLTLDVVRRQLAASLPDIATAANTVIAYEPVWAIGTGMTPSPADVAEVHAFIRAQLSGRYGEEGEWMRILYGGSVTPSNAKQLLAVANVDGALVGGASLKADDFLGIISVYRR
jgi:triosephosphate isomerase